MCRLLLDVLTYVNNYCHDVSSSPNLQSTNNIKNNILSSTQIHKCIRQILNRIARNHEQFKSYKSQHSNEQQDSQECLQAIIAMIIDESELEKNQQHDDESDVDCEEGGKRSMTSMTRMGEDGIRLGSKLFLPDEIYQQTANNDDDPIIRIHRHKNNSNSSNILKNVHKKKEDQDNVDGDEARNGDQGGNDDDQIVHGDDKVSSTEVPIEVTETETGLIDANDATVCPNQNLKHPSPISPPPHSNDDNLNLRHHHQTYPNQCKS